ncbi:MAG: metallophosphoesterase [Magnetococcales bacterium]|nr:metallophosphoesterase [Magnetococcales bacterium]
MGSRITIVLSDTDNDLKSIYYSLWMLGLINHTGAWKKGIDDFKLVHTGDWLNKSHPNSEVVLLWKNLRQTLPDHAELVILNGNHEVEILQRAEHRRRSGLSKADLGFIRKQDIMHVCDRYLYLHGYPTFELLRLLKDVKKETGCMNDFNNRFRKAFYEGKYALFREREGMAILGDIRQARDYYSSRSQDGETHGEKISVLLQKLGIDTVIHGHRPNMMIQQDFELKLEVPKIRFVNNDNKARLSKLGATLITETGQIRFINLREMYWAGGEKTYRKKLKKIVRGFGNKDRQSRMETDFVNHENYEQTG